MFLIKKRIIVSFKIQRRKEDRQVKRRERHGSREKDRSSDSKGRDDRRHREKERGRDKQFNERKDRYDDRSKSDR